MTVIEARKIFKGKIDHLSDEQVKQLIEEVKTFILFIRQKKDKLSKKLISKDNSKNKISTLIIK